MLFIWYFFKGLWNLVMGKLQNTDMIVNIFVIGVLTVMIRKSRRLCWIITLSRICL